jgi:CRISPR-associated protein (TIGR02584 family)
MNRRILLAVTGLSPQVVTETLYALCVASSKPWIPDEIRLITSHEGGERARLDLLDPEKGQFHAFCRDYPQAGKIAFRAEHIHIIARKGGVKLEDIRTPEDNTLAANAIHALVQKLTADENNELHVSIAGGRKTMGFYLGYCLSLYARPQDRLSHVLVSEPFEGLKDFYFPPREGRLLHTRDNRPIHTSNARVMLAEIPFVRLRRLLPDTAFAPQQSFSDAVAATQTLLEKQELRFNIHARKLICGDHEVHLPPQIFAWYLWFAERAKADLPYVRFTDGVQEEFLRHYVRVVGKDSAHYEKAQQNLKEGFTKEFFEEKCAKTNSALEKQLKLFAAPYRIVTSGKRPHTRYGIALKADAIHIDESADAGK